jgi:hypothetical protein
MSEEDFDVHLLSITDAIPSALSVFQHDQVESDNQDEVIKRILRDFDGKVLVIFDLDSGNKMDDLMALIDKVEQEGNRFACAHIKPLKQGLGLWAFERGMVERIRNVDRVNFMRVILKAEELEISCIKQEKLQ